MLLFSLLLARSPRFSVHTSVAAFFSWSSTSHYLSEPLMEKKGKWHNLLRTDVQPTEHCKSMVVSGSHWNLLICYDIVLYTVWNTDSFPLYGFWSLNLFCACVSFCFYFFFLFLFLHKSSFSPMAMNTVRREGKRKHCRSIGYLHTFYIMKYFKNKYMTRNVPCKLRCSWCSRSSTRTLIDLILVFSNECICFWHQRRYEKN